MKTHADDPRHRHVERLAEQHRLGLDSADAVAQNTEAVDHRRVRVSPDERVRERNAAALIRAIDDDRGQVLQVDLVDDPGSRWDDPQALERGLGPSQQLIPLTVALVLAFDVERERVRCPESVDLDRVVDDEVCRHQWIDLRRIAAEVGDGVSHSSEVNDRGHAGEVLEEDPGRHEWDLRSGLATWPPAGKDLNVGRAHQASAGVPQDVLKQDAKRDGRVINVEPIRQDGESVVVGQPGPRLALAPNGS